MARRLLEAGYKAAKAAKAADENAGIAALDPNRVGGYHGSDKLFDRFSSDFMGAGEGKQQYGAGHYASSDDMTARNFTPRDEAYEAELLSLYDRVKEGGDEVGAALVKLAMHNYRPSDFRKIADNPEYDDGARETAAAMAGWIEKRNPDIGHMYKVTVPNPGEMLDWDKKGKDQTDFVKKILRDADLYSDEKGGRFMYMDASPLSTSYEASTQRLKNVGIKGITYIDKGTGARNYVVFDDDEIKIIDKFGIPLAIGITAEKVIGDQLGRAEDES
tara:strand:- start:2364 stop:3185 length:822 start_codon:yes stop_codon:yes gene_type:complete